MLEPEALDFLPLSLACEKQSPIHRRQYPAGYAQLNDRPRNRRSQNGLGDFLCGEGGDPQRTHWPDQMMQSMIADMDAAADGEQLQYRDQEMAE